MCGWWEESMKRPPATPPGRLPPPHGATPEEVADYQAWLAANPPQCSSRNYAPVPPTRCKLNEGHDPPCKYPTETVVLTEEQLDSPEYWLSDQALAANVEHFAACTLRHERNACHLRELSREILKLRRFAIGKAVAPESPITGLEQATLRALEPTIEAQVRYSTLSPCICGCGPTTALSTHGLVFIGKCGGIVIKCKGCGEERLAERMFPRKDTSVVACPECGATDPGIPRTSAGYGRCLDDAGCQRRRGIAAVVANTKGSTPASDGRIAIGSRVIPEGDSREGVVTGIGLWPNSPLKYRVLFDDGFESGFASVQVAEPSNWQTVPRMQRLEKALSDIIVLGAPAPDGTYEPAEKRAWDMEQTARWAFDTSHVVKLWPGTSRPPAEDAASKVIEAACVVAQTVAPSTSKSILALHNAVDWYTAAGIDPQRPTVPRVMYEETCAQLRQVTAERDALRSAPQATSRPENFCGKCGNVLDCSYCRIMGSDTE